MYVLIVGGGKVGFHVARTLLAQGHEVAIIEQRPLRAQTLTRDLGDVVVVANGTLPSVLDAAGCARADIVAAVTGDDAANLLIATLAARQFQAVRTIVRLNDPRNARLFRRAGVESMVSSSMLLAELVEREVAAARVRTLLSFASGGVAIVQCDLSPRSRAAQRPVRDVVREEDWPGNTLLILILRGHEVVVPRGDTVLEAGDRLILAAPVAAEEHLQGLLAPDPA